MEVSHLESSKDGMALLLLETKNLSFSSLSPNLHLLHCSPSHWVVAPPIHYPGQKSKDNHWPFTLLLCHPCHIQSVTKSYQFDLLIISHIYFHYSYLYSDQIIPDLVYCNSLNTRLLASGLSLFQSAARLWALSLAIKSMVWGPQAPGS